MTNKKIPKITWYQNDDNIYLNIEIVNTNNYSIKLDNNITFQFTDEQYNINFDFTNPLTLVSDVNTGRVIKVVLKKNDNTLDSWNYLTKDSKLNKTHILIDWNNWIDSSSDSEPDNMQAMPDLSAMGGMPDLSAMGGMPDLSAMGGMPDLSAMGGMPDLSAMGGMPHTDTDTDTSNTVDNINSSDVELDDNDTEDLKCKECNCN